MHLLGSRVVLNGRMYRQAGRQTDMTKLIGAYRNSVNTPDKSLNRNVLLSPLKTKASRRW